MKPAIEYIPGSFLGRQSGWGTTVTTHLCLTLRLKFVELYFHSFVCLHGVYRSKFTFTIIFFYKSELVDIIMVLLGQNVCTTGILNEHLAKTVVIHIGTDFSFYHNIFIVTLGHAVTQLMHCASGWKVVDSISDGVIGIFH